MQSVVLGEAASNGSLPGARKTGTPQPVYNLFTDDAALGRELDRIWAQLQREYKSRGSDATDKRRPRLALNMESTQHGPEQHGPEQHGLEQHGLEQHFSRMQSGQSANAEQLRQVPAGKQHQHATARCSGAGPQVGIAKRLERYRDLPKEGVPRPTRKDASVGPESAHGLQKYDEGQKSKRKRELSPADEDIRRPELSSVYTGIKRGRGQRGGDEPRSGVGYDLGDDCSGRLKGQKKRPVDRPHRTLSA